jgi:hypothetical protein
MTEVLASQHQASDNDSFALLPGNCGAICCHKPAIISSAFDLAMSSPSFAPWSLLFLRVPSKLTAPTARLTTMPSRDFQRDLAQACLPGVFSRLSDVRAGSESGSFYFTYATPSKAHTIDVEAIVIGKVASSERLLTLELTSRSRYVRLPQTPQLLSVCHVVKCSRCGSYYP